MTMEALDSMLEEALTAADLKQLRLLQLRATRGACAFVRDWVAFNTDLNNVLTAAVCRKHGLDPRLFTIGARTRPGWEASQSPSGKRNIIPGSTSAPKMMRNQVSVFTGGGI